MQIIYGWLAGAIIVAALITGFIFITKHAGEGSVTTSTSTLSWASTTPSQGGSQLAATSSGPKIVVTSGNISGSTGAVPPPSLSGAISISPTLDPTLAAKMQADETSLITQLKATPTRTDLWLQLGQDRKIGGDYAGAIAAWNYVAKAGPSSINYIAYGNLGDLYQNFDVDYPLAETNYKAAIAINPTDVDYYSDLYYLYKYQYKTNTTDAADILAQGLKVNINNPTLLQLQQSASSSNSGN